MLSVTLSSNEKDAAETKKWHWQRQRPSAQTASSTAAKPIVRLKTQPLKSASASLGLSYGTCERERVSAQGSAAPSFPFGEGDDRLPRLARSTPSTPTRRREESETHKVSCVVDACERKVLDLAKLARSDRLVARPGELLRGVPSTQGLLAELVAVHPVEVTRPIGVTEPVAAVRRAGEGGRGGGRGRKESGRGKMAGSVSSRAHGSDDDEGESTHM